MHAPVSPRTIDTPAITRVGWQASARRSLLAKRLEIAVYDRMAAAEEAWRQLERGAHCSVYQRFEWSQCWMRTIGEPDGCEPRIVVAWLDGEPAFLLPTMQKGRYIRELNWIGGSHANFNMMLCSWKFLANAHDRDIRAIIRRVSKILSGVDLLRFCCQPMEWIGRRNLLAALPHQVSMNPGFCMELEGDFDAVLASHNAKRKRKKFRSQERAYNRIGGYRFIIAESRHDVRRILDVFYQQKSRQLGILGIKNVFADQTTDNFLKALAVDSLGLAEPLLALFALEVDGEIRATYGAGIQDDRLSGYFNSISYDETTQHSPGDMLLYLLIRHCSQQGMTMIDLGCGDERYKRSWCDKQIPSFDVIIANSIRGLPLKWMMMVVGAIKRELRKNPRMWKFVRKLRSRKARLLGDST